MEIVVRFERSDPPQGEVTSGDGSTARFVGWLGLLLELGRLVREGISRP